MIEVDNELQMMEVSNEEILDTIKQTNPLNSPRSDGMQTISIIKVGKS